MRHFGKVYRSILCSLIALVIAGSYTASCNVTCLAADDKNKVDLSAINGFGKDFTIDDKGKFEISGVMVTGNSMYNVTVEEDTLQAWCDSNKGRTWRDKELKNLLNNPTTFFYEKVSGDAESAEFSNKVEFQRPNGKSF
jgi:hypothetical protein